MIEDLRKRGMKVDPSPISKLFTSTIPITFMGKKESEESEDE